MDRAARIVVVRIKERLLGLLVDGASQVLKVKVSQIEPPPEEVWQQGGDYIRGVAKLDDRLIILVDLERLLAHELAAASARPRARAPSRSRTGSRRSDQDGPQHQVDPHQDARVARGIALAVAVTSVVYDLFAGEAVIHDQIVKRGRYVASNLAFNAKYGVLTEDKPLLTQFLEGAVNAGGTGETSDVVGAMIRDAKGETLAQIGKAIRDLPKDPAAKLEERDATTSDGDTVLLFRAPVTTSAAAAGSARSSRPRPRAPPRP